MNFSTKHISNYFLYDTSVENLFISEYMASAPGEYVKVYLLGSMCAQVEKPVNPADIAKKLGLTAQQVDDAWEYWEGMGIVERIFKNAERSGSYDVEFLNLKELCFSRSSGSESHAAKSYELDNKLLKNLYSSIEKITKRPLETQELSAVSSWLSDYGMDPQVISMCYKFCAENRRSTKYNYVGAILKDWKAAGLNSPEEVSEYLDDMDKYRGLYRRVFKALGFSRNPGEEEIRIMKRWFTELDFTIDEVIEACNKSSGISNPNINYVNSILMARYKEKNPGPEEEGSKPMTLDGYYEMLREKNNELSAKRRSEILSAIPGMGALLEDIKASGIRLSRAMLMGVNGENSFAKEKALAEELENKKIQLLEKNGYSSDYLDKVYSCHKCKDTGFLDDGSRCSCSIPILSMLNNNDRKDK